MTETEIRSTLIGLNDGLRHTSWCDFEVWSLIDNELVIMGGVTTTYYFTVKINFVDLSFIQIAQSWSSDTAEDIIQFSSIEEQKPINIGYEIEQGYTMFRINGTDKLPMYVSARDIKVEFKRFDRLQNNSLIHSD